MSEWRRVDFGKKSRRRNDSYTSWPGGASRGTSPAPCLERSRIRQILCSFPRNFTAISLRESAGNAITPRPKFWSAGCFRLHDAVGWFVRSNPNAPQTRTIVRPNSFRSYRDSGNSIFTRLWDHGRWSVLWPVHRHAKNWVQFFMNALKWSVQSRC